MSKSEVFNEDCMAVMARYPDQYFDLAGVIYLISAIALYIDACKLLRSTEESIRQRRESMETHRRRLDERQ